MKLLVHRTPQGIMGTSWTSEPDVDSKHFSWNTTKCDHVLWFIHQGVYHGQGVTVWGDSVIIYEWTATAKPERIISFWVEKQALEDVLVSHATIIRHDCHTNGLTKHG